MLEQALILSAHREYAAMFRQHLTLTIAAGARIDVETDPLRAMQLSPQQYDIILLDAVIGHMDGFQWMQVMKRQAPQTRFVVISEEPNEFFRFQAYQNGADLFLLRPQTDSEWKAAMAAIARLAELPSLESATGTESVQLGELITAECAAKHSVVIQVDVIGNTGDIFIHEGDVYHAQCSGISGERAFHGILSWPKDRMRTQVHSLNHAPPRTIERDLAGLLHNEMSAPTLISGSKSDLDSQFTVTTLELPESVKLADDVTAMEAPPLEEPPEFETPYKLETPRDSSFASPGLQSHWRIDLMGNFLDGNGAVDPGHSAALTFFIYRKMAEVAVALDEDYFQRLTLIGPDFRQELVADNLGVHHAVFKTRGVSAEEPAQFVSWCYEHSV